jgi:hypothetical protein
MAESRSDSLAQDLKRRGLFDEYFAFWLTERPPYKARLQWLKDNGVVSSNGAIWNLHRSPEASEWRFAEGAKAREAMRQNLPSDLPEQIRESLLQQRFNAVLGELSHKELMDHTAAEQTAEALKLKERALDQKDEDLAQRDRRIKILEENQARASAELKKLRDPSTANSEAERQAILDEVDRLMGLKK